MSTINILYECKKNNVDLFKALSRCKIKFFRIRYGCSAFLFISIVSEALLSNYNFTKKTKTITKSEDTL